LRRSRARQPLSALRTSLCQIVEPAAGMPKRELENGEQRLAPQNYPPGPESPEFADRRLGRDSLIHGTVGGSHTPGNPIVETALAGCSGVCAIIPKISLAADVDAVVAAGAALVHEQTKAVLLLGGEGVGIALEELVKPGGGGGSA